MELYAKDKFRLEIKKYKGEIFQQGFYFYAGSAQKNFSHRIARHLKKAKTIHWHIDHLTSNESLEIKRIFALPNAAKEEECRLVNNLIEIFNFGFPLNGFGNSDCNSCSSHLLYSKTSIDQSQFFSLYQSMVLFNPSSSEISG